MPRPARVKRCAECGEPFSAVRVDARYCSDRCQKRATRRRRSEKSSADRLDR